MTTKILLTIAITIFIAASSDAQISQGRYLLGGSVNFTTSKNVQPYNATNYNYQSSYANIQIGKVVKQNTVVGLILSYGNNNSHVTGYPDSIYNKINQFSAGLFYRKYKKLFDALYIFGEVDAAYLHTDNSQGTYQDKRDRYKILSDGGSVTFVPGIAYTLFKRMQVELSMPNIVAVTYLHSKSGFINAASQSYPNEGNSFGLNASLNSNLLSNFGIGFKFLLGK